MIPVLLVEGNRIESDGLQRSLKRFGYFVEVADDITAATRWMEQQPFAVVVTELVFPESESTSSGWEGTTLIRDTRAKGITTPLLAYTWFGEQWYAEAALNAGADEIIPKGKPLSFLLSRLNAYLHGSERSSRVCVNEDEMPTPKYGRLQLGEIVLDREGSRLLSKDDTISLTWRELKLLETLAACSGQIVSNQELLDGAWRDVVQGKEPALLRAVQRLRQKMKSFAMPDLIHTARGAAIR